jgi:hypothetical protein
VRKVDKYYTYFKESVTNEFEVGERVIYNNAGSKHNGKTLMIVKVTHNARNIYNGTDTKYEILYDCGIIEKLVKVTLKNVPPDRLEKISKESYKDEDIKWFVDESKLYESKSKHFKVNDICIYNKEGSKYKGEKVVITKIEDVNQYKGMDECMIRVKTISIPGNNYMFIVRKFKDLLKEEDKENYDEIQWFENKIYENHIPSINDVGKKVKINDNSHHHFQAYEKGGNEYGVIIDYNIPDQYGYCFDIRWNSGEENQYRLEDIEFVEEEDYDDGNIKWFENKIFESEGIDLVGRRVKIKDDSKYKHEAYEKGDKGHGDGFGKIVEYSIEKFVPNHKYSIEWDSGKSNAYNRKDFELVDDVQPESYSEIQWFESNDELSVPDVKITVKDGESLAKQLINKLSLVIQKRTRKAIRVKSVNGYANKKTHYGKKMYYDTYLEVTMINKDFITGEYNSRNGNIKITINDKVVFDIDNRHFDNEELIEKMTSVYKKYLSKGNYKLYETNKYFQMKYLSLSQIYHATDDEGKFDAVKADRILNNYLQNKMVAFYEKVKNQYHEGNVYHYLLVKNVFFNDKFEICFMDDNHKRYVVNSGYGVYYNDAEIKEEDIEWF